MRALELGWAVERAVIEPSFCEYVVAKLRELPPRSVDPFNPPAWAEDAGTRPHLCMLSHHPRLLDFAETILGFCIGLYNQRFLAKDQAARAAVPLHQDAPYHRGHPSKWSFFVALSPATRENGALIVYERSHLLGNLGDAGEIKRSLLDDYKFAAVQPELMPGDVLAMHSSCWHESPAHTGGPDRLMADVILQQTSDPSTVEVLRGRRLADLTMPTDPFVRSRVSRLRELQAEVDRRAA